MDTKQKILKQARKLILRSGYEAFRLDDILLDMNLSKGGFYHHFKSVEALLSELIREDFARDMELIEAASLNKDVRKAIMQIFKVGSSHLDGNSGVLKKLKSTKNRRLYLNLMDDAWYLPFKSIFSALLHRGVEQGQLPAVDVGIVCELFEALNRHANRAEILNLWQEDIELGYAVASLELLAEKLGMEKEVGEIKKGWK